MRTIESYSDGKGTRFERDWTKGSIIGNLFSLTWPMWITRAFMTLVPTLDMMWMGRLGGVSPIAGVGIGGMLVMLVDSLKMGLSTGLRAMVARSVGEGNKDNAIHAAQQGFVISAIFSIILAAIGIFLTEELLLLIGVQSDVVVQAAPYMRIQFVGSIFMAFRMTTDAIMEASGDTVTPMKLAFVYRLFQIVLCPFLVFGWWLFPRLEISGAAWAAVVANSLGMSLGLWILLTGRSRLRLSFKNFRLDHNLIWRLIKVSIPASISGMQWSLSSLLVLWFIVPFGTLALAAHTLSGRVAMFMHMPTNGWGMAAGVLAGQNLGAQKPERAEKTGWLAAGLVSGIMILVSIMIWFYAEGSARIFTSQSDLVSLTGIFLRIEIVGMLMLGPAMVLSECLNGVGSTLPIMIIGLTTLWGLQIPLAYLLPQITNLGVFGIRWALVIGMVARAVIYTTYFKMGRWKRKRI